MNLHSPIFDAIRIPARKTPEWVASRVCAELGVDPKDMRKHLRWTPERIVTREAIIKAMRECAIAQKEMANWFNRSPSQVNTWIQEMDERQ